MRSVSRQSKCCQKAGPICSLLHTYYMKTTHVTLLASHTCVQQQILSCFHVFFRFSYSFCLPYSYHPMSFHRSNTLRILRAYILLLFATFAVGVRAQSGEQIQ